jgi:hypothetical protein
MESDETRIFNAAHLMVASLAGSLAHVTCKVISNTKFSQFLYPVWFWIAKQNSSDIYFKLSAFNFCC